MNNKHVNEDVTVTNEKNRLKNWIYENKNELVGLGISLTVLLLVVAGVRKKEQVTELIEYLQKRVCVKTTPNSIVVVQDKVPEVLGFTRKYTSPIEPFGVSEHIRNLPNGAHASADKISEALSKGIQLLPNQTIVSAYKKGTKIA